MMDLRPDYWTAHTPKRRGPYAGYCIRYRKRQRGMYNRPRAYREAYLKERALLNFQSNMWDAQRRRATDTVTP